MSMKNYLVLAAASVAALGATAALAGGPDHMCPPQEPQNAMHVYVEAGGGYTWGDWKSLVRSAETQWSSGAIMNKGAKKGGVAIADVGFQFLTNWAVEAGAIYLPKVKGSSSINAAGAVVIGSDGGVVGTSLYSFVYYGALRISAPVPYLEDLQGFAKLGVAFRGAKGGEPNILRPFSTYRTSILPLFAGGLKYQFWDTGFSVNSQFTYLGNQLRLKSQLAQNNAILRSKNSPAYYIITAGAGYQFDF